MSLNVLALGLLIIPFRDYVPRLVRGIHGWRGQAAPRRHFGSNGQHIINKRIIFSVLDPKKPFVLFVKVQIMVWVGLGLLLFSPMSFSQPTTPGGMGSLPSWISSNINIIQNIASNLLPVQNLIKGAAYVLGLAFAFKALYSLKIYGEARTMMSQHGSLKEPLTYLFVAAILLILPNTLQTLLNATFGSPNILGYSPINSQNPTFNSLFGSESEAGASIVLIIQTIGYIAFVRGWMIVVQASSSQGGQPGTLGKGLIHVLGGILAINIVGTLQIVNNTLYGS